MKTLISGHLERISSSIFDRYHAEMTKLVTKRRWAVLDELKKKAFFWVIPEGNMKPVFSGTILLILLLLGIQCRRLEQPYRFYATYSEALSGEANHGWFSGWVPASAVRIHLQNDVDNNRYWLRFETPKHSADSLKTRLESVDNKSVVVTQPSGADWWFEELNGNALHAEVYRMIDDSTGTISIIAFDRLSEKVYVWGGLVETAP